MRPICGLPRSHHDHHVFKFATSHSAPLHLFRISSTKTHAVQRYPRLSPVSTSSFTCQRCTKHTRLLIVIHPRKQKKQCPTTTKRKLPRKVKFLHHLCHYVVIVVFNEMDCQIISSPEVPPYTRYGLKLPPPQKKRIKPVIGSLASLFCQKSSQHLGSHEYTLIWYIHIRAIFVWLATHKITHKLQTWCQVFLTYDDWWLLLICYKPIWDSTMNKCLESKQSNETCRPLSLDKNTFTWTMIVMISSCFYIAQKLLKSENPYSNNFTCVMCKSPKTAGTLNTHLPGVILIINGAA